MTAETLVESARAAGLPLPSAQVLVQRFGITEEEAGEVLKENKKNIEITGYNKATDKNSKIVRRTSNDSIKGMGKDNKYVQNKTQETTPTTIGKQPVGLRQRVQGLLLATLPFIFFFASVAGSIRSYTLCYGYFVRFNDHFDAMMLSVMLVATAFAVPQAVPILWESFRKGQRILMFFIAVLISLGTIGTNVLITATELANQKTETYTGMSEQAERRTQIEARIRSLEGRGNDLRELLDIDKAERLGLMESQKKYEVGTYEYNRVRNNLADSKKRIDDGQAEMQVILESVDGLRQELSGLPAMVDGGKMSDVDRVIMYMSAVLIEVSSPLALSLALFL